MLDGVRRKLDRVHIDAVAGGLALDERTEGEYRVLSEDAIFDALGDANRLAWGWMRLAMAALDPARDASA
ncbi:DUF4298 domain-containing protein [Cardiobacterium hominis]|uniref:DUF4298 domain-containing protein n=1 Tax=Cardiobacterium hominis TaxID=2718 RepID=UPI00288BB3D2|nr:DUF4298 domain-containing protein [Cardiobacterium hominis]